MWMTACWCSHADVSITHMLMIACWWQHVDDRMLMFTMQLRMPMWMSNSHVPAYALEWRVCMPVCVKDCAFQHVLVVYQFVLKGACQPVSRNACQPASRNACQPVLKSLFQHVLTIIRPTGVCKKWQRVRRCLTQFVCDMIADICFVSFGQNITRCISHIYRFDSSVDVRYLPGISWQDACRTSMMMSWRAFVFL